MVVPWRVDHRPKLSGDEPDGEMPHFAGVPGGKRHDGSPLKNGGVGQADPVFGKIGGALSQVPSELYPLDFVHTISSLATVFRTDQTLEEWTET